MPQKDRQTRQRSSSAGKRKNPMFLKPRVVLFVQNGEMHFILEEIIVFNSVLIRKTVDAVTAEATKTSQVNINKQQ